MKLRKNICVDAELWKRLQEIAKENNRSASNMVEELIKAYQKH